MANETYADPYADLTPPAAGGATYTDPYADLSTKAFAPGLPGRYLESRPWTRDIPILNLPDIYGEMRREGQEQMAAGYRMATGQAPEGVTAGNIGRGALGMLGGAIQYAGAPAWTLYRGMLGEPVQRGTSGYVPKEWTEFAAQLATPGIGLLQAGGRAAVRPVATTVARPPAATPLLQAAQDLNITLPRAVTSESMPVQQFGKIAENVPIFNVPLRRAATRATEQLGERAEEARATLGTGQPAAAGGAVREGIEGALARGPMKRRVDALYNRLDHMVDPAATGQMPGTLREALQIERERMAAGLPRSKVNELLDEPLRRGGITYEGIKDLRSYFGEMLRGRAPIPEGMGRAELERIYGTLSNDLRGVVEAAGGPDAVKVWERANAMAGNWAKTRTQLANVLKVKNDEGIVDKLYGMSMDKGGDLEQLLRIRNNIPREHWDELASGIMGRMGWRPGGTGFSPDAFLTEYNKMSLHAQRMIFGDVAPMIDNIARVSQRFKELQRFANPSGTGQTVMGGLMAGAMGGEGYAALLHPILALKTAALSAPVAAAGYAASKWLASPEGSSMLRGWLQAQGGPGAAMATRIMAADMARGTGAPIETILDQLQGPQR